MTRILLSGREVGKLEEAKTHCIMRILKSATTTVSYLLAAVARAPLPPLDAMMGPTTRVARG